MDELRSDKVPDFFSFNSLIWDVFVTELYTIVYWGQFNVFINVSNKRTNIYYLTIKRHR